MEMRSEKGFFAFIVDAQKDAVMLDEFLNTKSLIDLTKFFGKHPSYEIDENECDKIWAAREALCKKMTPQELFDIVCGGRGY